MIWDAQNLFLNNVAGTTYGTTPAYSDVIANGGGGGAYVPPFLVIAVKTAALAGGNLTIVLQTCDAEGFGSNVVDLDTYTIASGAKGIMVKERIPVVGLKKYLRLKITGSASISAGVLQAGLVVDVDVQ